MRFHPFKRIPQMVHIFVGPAWPKTRLNQIEIFVIKLFTLLRIIDFKYSQCFHHLPWFYFVSTLSENGRNNYLKVGADRYQCSMVVIHVSVSWMLERVFVALINQHKVFLVDILIVFECVLYDLHVVEDGLWLLGTLIGSVLMSWWDRWNFFWTGLVLHCQY